MTEAFPPPKVMGTAEPAVMAALPLPCVLATESSLITSGVLPPGCEQGVVAHHGADLCEPVGIGTILLLLLIVQSV